MESQFINTYFNDQVQDIFDQNQSDLFERKYDNFLNKMIEIFDKPDEEQEQDLFKDKYNNPLLKKWSKTIN
jgi:hypothetical protein